MIALLLSMLRARRGQAITVFLLSAVATAAAVAGPIAMNTVDIAVIRNEVGQARPAERSISVVDFTDPSDAAASATFDALVGPLRLPGFDVVRAGELEAFGPFAVNATIDFDDSVRIAFRDRVCDHIVIVAGRCLTSTLEVVLGERSAAAAGLRPGDVTVVQAARFDALSGSLVPDGAPTRLTVVGTYRPRDVNDVYWGSQVYFPVNPDGAVDEPVFLGVGTFDVIDHTIGSTTADLLAGPDVFAAGGLAVLAEQVEAITNPEESSEPQVTVSTELAALIERIERGRDVAGQLVPVAFTPLVGLCWFVVFLAVSYGLVARRHEIGLVTLRGTRPARRWWLAVAETSVMIVAGAPVGYLLGHLIVGLVASIRLGSAEGSELSLAAIPYALIALVGALVVSVLGQRRAIAEPVVDLLRGVPARLAHWRAFVVELTVVAVAVLGVLQLQAVAKLSGVVLLVPGLVVVAVCLVVARLFVPVVGGIARLALRTGRLGSGLAAIQIARRPGSQRLFALLAVALGQLTFVTAGVGVAAEARGDRADILVGAPRILAADRVSMAQLLATTRRADPEGAWAMAVLPVDQSDPAAPPMLAVDSSRLAAVATWRSEFGPGASDVAALLQPPPARPMTLTADAFTIDVERLPHSGIEFDLDGPDADAGPVLLVIRFESLRDGTAVATELAVTMGRRVLTGRASGCEAGCRLTGFSVSDPNAEPFNLTIHSLRAASSAADVITTEDFNDRSRWAGSVGAVVAPFNNALSLQEGGGFGEAGLSVTAVDVPRPMPAVSTVDSMLPVRQGADYLEVSVQQKVPMLPRLATSGTLVDLEYLQRAGEPAAARSVGEVWLGPAAPADAAQRLRDAGLSVRLSDSIERTFTALERSGPALALQFHLAAAALGIVLALGGVGLVAAVDRRRRAEDLRALRLQGLPRRYVRRASLWGYLWLVVGAAVAGLLAGGIAWWATGADLPIFTDTLGQLPPPSWPEPSVVAVPWLVATAAMIAAAFAAAWILRGTVQSWLNRSARSRG